MPFLCARLRVCLQAEARSAAAELVYGLYLPNRGESFASFINGLSPKSVNCRRLWMSVPLLSCTKKTKMGLKKPSVSGSVLLLKVTPVISATFRPDCCTPVFAVCLIFFSPSTLVDTGPMHTRRGCQSDGFGHRRSSGCSNWKYRTALKHHFPFTLLS